MITLPNDTRITISDDQIYYGDWILRQEHFFDSETDILHSWWVGEYPFVETLQGETLEDLIDQISSL